MTRGQMRAMLRRRVDDVRNTRWPNNSDLNAELNAAATYLAHQISLYQRVNFLNGRITITTTTALGRIYDLEAATPGTLPRVGSVGKVWFVYEDTAGTGAGRACEQIDEREEALRSDTTGRNDFGRWEYYIRRQDMIREAGLTSGSPVAVGMLQIGFVRSPGERTFIVVVSLLPGDIADDAGDGVNDAASFLLIPVQYHELIVVRAGLQLIGTDDARYDFLSSTWNDLYRKLLDDIGYMPDIQSLRRLPRGATPQLLSPATRRPTPEGFGAPGGAGEP